MNIRFSQPYVTGQELPYIQEAMAAGRLAGDNAFTKRCQRLLEESLQVARVLLTPSCTHALEMAALLLDIVPGDEVILPSFTFVSTVNAFVLRGATPVFADIHPDTLNLDERLLPKLITPRTKAIVPVHYAGVGCAMESLLPLAQEHGIKVVEDNAHGLFGKYHGQYLGTFGTLSTLSFHDTKNFTCGEGGAVLINDPAYIERAEIIREKGTDRSRFYRGQVDKYTWVDVGSSYLLGEIPAAFLLAQLEARELIQAKRQQIWEFYCAHLREWAAGQGIQLPTIPPGAEQAYHMFYLLMPDLNQRQAFLAYLKARGISAVFHYIPLHLSTMGAKFGGKVGGCPVTEAVSEHLVRLPFHNNLSAADLDYIVEAILAWDCGT